ncbi:fumarate hydratase C-terminal domain-containing protein, partial [Desulfovibrio piger]|uniref:fumarate hydratase C-terminal domain-containing protein n=1 Tax=Desulfovibrio piger TaxID=901 RepID=UPI0039F4985C
SRPTAVNLFWALDRMARKASDCGGDPAALLAEAEVIHREDVAMNRAIGAAGPTTAGRMDAYTPTLLDQGLRGMIGKGYRKPDVVEAMQRHGVPYLAAVGGAGALISQRIKKYTVLAYPDLGPEAVAALEVEDFPAIVVIDSTGDNYYETGQAPYRKL